MMYGMTDKEIAALRSVLARHPNVEQAILYGSRAKGTQKAYSDIDMTLKGNINHSELSRIYVEIDDLLLPYQLDLSAYSRLTDNAFKEHIQRVGVPLYTHNAQ